MLQVFRKIVNDPRFSALSTLGEKKQCFHEYVQQRRNEEKEEERRKARQAREDFVKMLEESGNVDSRTKWVLGGDGLLAAGAGAGAVCRHGAPVCCGDG